MRWAPGARARLERAALDLFAEQGYAATTVPQITERAGLTTRTFFRYFEDKREVLFAGNEIPNATAQLIADAPSGLKPLEVLTTVLHEVAESRFEGQQANTAAWRRVVEANDALRDRDARKRSDMVRAAQAAFVKRGVPELEATVAAELGVALFQVSLEKWAAASEAASLVETIDEVLAVALTVAS